MGEASLEDDDCRAVPIFGPMVTIAITPRGLRRDCDAAQFIVGSGSPDGPKAY